MDDVRGEGDNRVPTLLAAVERGDQNALEELVIAVYPELKRLAHMQLVKERPDHTLDTTAIVHEAFLRLAGGRNRWADRGHFLRAASTVMRHLLVDHARKRAAGKRGDGRVPITLEDERAASDDDSLAVLALDHAIDEVAKIDPRLGQIIECRYFAGLSVAETAEALGVGVRTVERDWQRAKAYLLDAMESNER